MPAAPLVVGIDSSTQSTKAVACRLDTGEIVAAGSAPHPPTEPPVSEQDPDAWWSALVAALGQLGRHRADVVGIAVAGQQHGLVLLDGTGRVLRPAKLWNDTTSAPQAERLVAGLGASRWAEATGTVPVASITVSKLAWVVEHEPDLLDDVAMVMLPHDWLTWRLSGAHVSDRGDASGTGWFDPRSDAYLPEMLDASGVEGQAWVGRLPRVLAPTEAAGTVLAAVAEELDLPSGVAVGPGTGDNMGAALGLGLRSGDVAISLGTSGTAFAVSAEPTADPTGHVAGFASASGEHLPLVCTLNATKVTDRFATWLDVGADELARLALAAPEWGGVRLLPYFDGERTPNLPGATGTLAGLTNTTTREQLALAAHDGVLCGLLDGVDALEAAGASIDGRRFLVGGGARSEAYRRRSADLSAQPVVVPEAGEIVAVGAAVQAAAVTEQISIGEIAHRWDLGQGTIVEPRAGRAEEAAEIRAMHRA